MYTKINFNGLQPLNKEYIHQELFEFLELLNKVTTEIYISINCRFVIFDSDIGYIDITPIIKQINFDFNAPRAMIKFYNL